MASVLEDIAEISVDKSNRVVQKCSGSDLVHGCMYLILNKTLIGLQFFVNQKAIISTFDKVLLNMNKTVTMGYFFHKIEEIWLNKSLQIQIKDRK